MVAATALLVTAADRPLWQRRLLDGQQSGRWLHVERLSEGPYYLHALVYVQSLSRPDLSHDVLIDQDMDTTTVQCTCEYHTLRHGPCVHAALALDFLRCWPWDVWAEPEPETFPCRHCGVIYDDADALARHYALGHRATPRPAVSLGLSDARVNPLLRGRT